MLKKIIRALTIAVTLASGLYHATAQDIPTKSVDTDMIFTFSLKQAAAGIGYSWGEGELRYGGQTYHFRIEGGGIAALGYNVVRGTGRVFDIKKLSDFDGTYWTLSADAAAGRGRDVFVMENQYGVRVNMRGESNGGYLSASIKRLRFRLLGVVGIDRDELR